MTEVEKRKGFGLRVVDGVALVAVGVVAVVLAFWCCPSSPGSCGASSSWSS